MDIKKERKQPGEMVDVNQVVNDTVDKLANLLEDPNRGSTKNLTELRDSLNKLRNIDKNVPYELFPSTIDRLNKIQDNLPKLEHEKNPLVSRPLKDQQNIGETDKIEKEGVDLSTQVTTEKDTTNIEDDNIDKIIKTIETVIEIKEKSSKKETNIEVSDRIINKAVENVLLDVLEAAAKRAVEIGSTKKTLKDSNELEINPRENEKNLNSFNNDNEKSVKETQSKDFNIQKNDKSSESVGSIRPRADKNNQPVVVQNVETDKNNNLLNNINPEQKKLMDYIMIAAKEELKDEQQINSLRVSLESYFRDENSIIEDTTQGDGKTENNLNSPEKNIKEQNELDDRIVTSDKESNKFETVEITDKNLETIEQIETEELKEPNNLVSPEATSKKLAEVEEANSTSSKGNNKLITTDKENNKEGNTAFKKEELKDTAKSFNMQVEPTTAGQLPDIVLGEKTVNSNWKPTTALRKIEEEEVVYDAYPPPIGGDDGGNNKYSSLRDNTTANYLNRYEEGKIDIAALNDTEKNEDIAFGKEYQREVKDGDGNVVQPSKSYDELPGLSASKSLVSFGKEHQKEVKDEDGNVVQPSKSYDELPGVGLRKTSSSTVDTAGTVGGLLGDMFGAGSGIFAYPLNGVYENFSGVKSFKRSLNFGENVGGIFNRVSVPEIPEGSAGKNDSPFQQTGTYSKQTADQIQEEIANAKLYKAQQPKFSLLNGNTDRQNTIENSIKYALIKSESRKNEKEYSKLKYQNDNNIRENDITFVNEGNAYINKSTGEKVNIIKEGDQAPKSRNANSSKISNHPVFTGFLKIYQKRALDFEGTVENGDSKIMPFQFEPIYEGDGKKAEYSSISTLGRSASTKVYTKSSERQMQLSLTYIVTGPSNDQEKINGGNSLSSKGMSEWDENYIYGYIIPNFRNLVKPDIKNELAYRLAPPIVQIWYGGLDEFDAYSSGAQKTRKSLMDVPPAFLTSWYTADGSFRTYRSLWLATSVDIEYDGGIINSTSRNKLIAKVNLSLTEIAPSVVSNGVLNWWDPIR